MNSISTNEEIIISKENIQVTTKLNISCTETDIKIVITRGLKKYIYSTIFSDLKNKNNDFQFFPTTKIFVNGVKKLIENKSYSLEINEDKSILKLQNPLFENPIIFEIPCEINIVDENNNLKKYNELLKNDIQKLKEELENIKKQNIENNNSEEIINQMTEVFRLSELTKNECTLLYNWLNLKSKNIKFGLLYNTKIDGDKASEFHKKCDGKSPTITIIKTTKGYRFGGYTTKCWIKATRWEYFKDSEAFLFSFFHNKKYIIRNSNEDAIGCHEIRGPSFGYDAKDIYIWEGCTQTNENRCETPYSYLTTQKSELTNGDVHFQVDHYEVYIIEIY